ncbi:hypothetical protein J4N02_00230 [Propioniciclava sp. MC1595]|uniref:hypothetical protein n=1 Tax=Propioniciclava sp. MC1595 TaxID=2760308 RepID=UPI00166233A8|nr:hypothetical protein [Propioniciclava sp. MC1595]MBB1496461.1 hypothetical protein [Propioniciclava sp. MC1595]QTE26113.1 hypothetical protein J4N02_00230 [Propioniciclava sp. MC1595]
MFNTEGDDLGDLGLLDLSLLALAAAGFTAKIDDVSSVPVVHAESELMVVLVGSATTVDGLLALEPILSSAMIGLLGDHKIPDRRRDGYVLLLTSQRAEARQGESLFGVTYNLRHVRRIVRVGIDATAAGVARALRPVLPLAAVTAGTETLDPIDEMSSRLIQDGLDAEAVQAVIRRFRSAPSTELRPELETDVVE